VARNAVKWWRRINDPSMASRCRFFAQTAQIII
jgi:hypothetical protein